MFKRLAGRALGGLIALAAVAPSAGAQGVTVALTPGGQQVAPGATFTVEVTVTSPGSPFNGFDAVIGYDPSALTLVPMSPTTLQQGSLMTGACANTFHRFRQGTGTDTVACVLLCSGVSVTGPGQIYRLQFRAATTPQVTVIRFLPGLQFYQAGLYVNPVHSANALVGIGMPAPVGVEPTVVPGSPGLVVAPNPARRGAVFTLEADRSGPQRLVLLDVRGRLVRVLEDSNAAAGTRTFAWDGLDGSGRPAEPGVYLVRFQVAGRSVSRRITVIH